MVVSRYYTCCHVSLKQTPEQHQELHAKLHMKRRNNNYAKGVRNKDGTIPMRPLPSSYLDYTITVKKNKITWVKKAMKKLDRLNNRRKK